MSQDEYYEATALSAEDLSLQREGLPRDYRMRHEEHYVDELMASGRMPQLRLVPVRDIDRQPANGSESLEGLADSIEAFGVLQPLLVRRNKGRFELLAGAKRLVAAEKAGLTEVPCLVHDVDDTEARRLAEAANRSGLPGPFAAGPSAPFSAAEASNLVRTSLETILSTLGLLDRPDSPLRDQVAVGLIRAEAVRAARLLDGLRLLEREPAVMRREVDFIAVVQSALESSHDERGLLGIVLEASLPETCSLRADERLVQVAVAGSLETIVALLRSGRGAKLRVHASKNDLARSVTLMVSEDAARIPTASWSRWFDPSWDGRPGGFNAAVSLLAARRAAELHGGRLELSPTEAGGCRLTLTLPVGA